MADAKKCDHCGAFYDPNIEQGFRITRDSGPEGSRQYGLRYEWDICSSACLLAEADLHVKNDALHERQREDAAAIAADRRR